MSILSVDSGVLNAPRTTRVNILDDENPVVIDPEPPLTSRYEVTEVDLFTLTRPTSMAFLPGTDLLYIGDQLGRVFTYNVETGARERFIDLSAEVSFGQGLQGIALHPDFENNPYVYLYYAVDPPETRSATGNAGVDGEGNRFQWLVRVEADADRDYLRAVPGSKTILLGGAGQSLDDISGRGALRFTLGEAYRDLPASDQINLSAAEIAAGLEYRQNFIKGDGEHIGGGMAFGPDGMLYVAIGDNAAFNFGDPRAFSVQDVDSLNGKILRIDPITGRGLASNPFVETGDSLDLNRAKVYQYGLRNPFHISFNSEGELIITDVGHTSYEEINIGGPGANFGWPFYEGADYNALSIPPNFRPTPRNGFQDEWDAFLAGDPDITAPFKGFSHSDADPGFRIQTIVGSNVEFTSDRYPDSLLGRYLFSDYSTGNVFTIDLDDRESTELLYSKNGTAPIRLAEGPDGYVYYLNPISGRVGRLEISETPRDDDVIGTVTQVRSNHDARSFSYGEDVTLDNPVLFSSVTRNGGAAITVLFSDIGESGARVFVKEPTTSSNPYHATETISVVALEEGVWRVGDGRQLIVGTVDVASGGTATVRFDRAFDSAPLILTQIQSQVGGTEWAVVRPISITETGFRVRVRDELLDDRAPLAAKVGFLAIEAGADTFEWNDTTTQAFATGLLVTDNWRRFDLASALGDDAIVALSMISAADPEPATLRTRFADDDSLRLRAQEETGGGTGTRAPERVHGLAFEDTGVLTGVDLLV